MSNWRLNDFRGKPELWCHDLGIIKRFTPNGIPENGDEPLSERGGVVETEDGSFRYGISRELVPWLMGYDSIARFASYETLKPLYIPDKAEGGYKVDPKEFNLEVYYKGKPIEANCDDNRFLAIIIFQIVAKGAGIPYRKIREVFERVPTMKAARNFLRKNNFEWDEPLSFRELNRMPQEEISKRLEKVPDLSPLFDEFEH